MKKILLLFIITFLSLSCTSHKNSAEKTPSDFYFNLDWGNEYFSSRKNAFYRQYESSIDSVKVELTESEKAKAYKLINDFQFNSFPESFENSSNEIPTDAGKYQLKITVHENGKLKTVFYDNRNVTESKKEKAKPFFELLKSLSEIVREKQAVKSMKYSTID